MDEGAEDRVGRGGAVLVLGCAGRLLLLLLLERGGAVVVLGCAGRLLLVLLLERGAAVVVLGCAGRLLLLVERGSAELMKRQEEEKGNEGQGTTTLPDRLQVKRTNTKANTKTCNTPSYHVRWMPWKVGRGAGGAVVI